ncbi:MAG: type pilus assembly protein PilC [Actinomycetota bacterium]|nr:type pilus assembly protein PilC [Actinomycetota bacterium]
MATTFEYSVRNKDGKVTKGRVEGDSKAVVAEKLKTMGYNPLSLDEVKTTGLNKQISFGGEKRVKLKDLSIFSRQFATMINSGLSLLRSLSILEEQTENPTLAKVLGKVRAEVEGGSSLSAAMAKHPQVFPPIMIHMTRAGEVGGFLDKVMSQLAANFEAEVRLHGKIKSAMTYPVVVFAMAVLAMSAMLLFIVPVFASMFASLGGTLPLPTRILVWLSGALKIVMPFLIVFLIVFTWWWRKHKRDAKVRNFVDPLKLKAPIFGGLAQKIAISRFTRNLGTMVHSGVPILQALDITGQTTGNVVIERAVEDVQESVRRGEPLARPLANHPVFPPMVVQMMSVGEDTGALDLMLGKISDFYDAEVEATTESLTSLIEPLMIAVVGGMIGAMIIALYMPIFKVFDLIQ